MTEYLDPATGRRLEGCAFGPCRLSTSRGGPGCYMCDVMPTKFPQPFRRELAAADPADEREQSNPERDGAPTLSGERTRRHPMWNKRHRDGPHRSNA